MRKIMMRINNQRMKKSLKISLKMKIKNLTLILLKMIIKTLKESEKYANMIKKYKKILKENLILKNKEIKSVPK